MATVKCRYSNCKYDSKEIDKDKAIKCGNMYYHKDCYKEKENKKIIVDLFVKCINPHPVYNQLHSVINNIINQKGVSSDFLLFGLKYYIEHKIPLNYPQGLYYVIQNKQVIKAYNDKKNKKEILNLNSFVVQEDNEVEFNYKPTKVKGFADILGG